MEEGWQRQVDTVITIIDVICLSFISANVCCILFVLLDVKIKYANCEMEMDVSEMNGCQTLSFIASHLSNKTFFFSIRSREVNFKQHTILKWQYLYFV